MSELIIAKIGTTEIVKDGQPMEGGVAGIYEQADWLRARGCMTLLVCSGANALGGGQLGQAALMDYMKAETDGRAHEITVTDACLSEPDRYWQEVTAVFSRGDTPSINSVPGTPANSLVSNNDWVGAKNAEIAARFGWDVVYVNFTTKGGLFDDERNLVPLVTPENLAACRSYIDSDISPDGTGGMETKFDYVWGSVARQHARRGSITHIGDPDALIRSAVDGTRVGTTFTLGGAGLSLVADSMRDA